MQKMRRCAGLEWAKVFHWRSEQMIDGLQYLCVLSLTQTVLPKLVLFHIPTTVTSVASTSHKMSALRNSKNIKRPSSKSTCTWGQAELGVWRRLGPDHWTDRELPEPKQIWIFKKEKKKFCLRQPWNPEIVAPLRVLFFSSWNAADPESPRFELCGPLTSDLPVRQWQPLIVSINALQCYELFSHPCHVLNTFLQLTSL